MAGCKKAASNGLNPMISVKNLLLARSLIESRNQTQFGLRPTPTSAKVAKTVPIKETPLMRLLVSNQRESEQ